MQWTSPSQMWALAASLPSGPTRKVALMRPSILRFATDSFMEDFISLLQNDPARLTDYVAKPETWRGPAAEPEPVSTAPIFARALNRLRLVAERNKAKSSPQLSSGGNESSNALISGTTTQKKKQDIPLKLYQPAHQRFYLITSCLVCNRAGLPDHIINAGRQERTTFVIRRLFPSGPLDVHAALGKPDNSWEEYAFVEDEKGFKWKRIPNNAANLAQALIGGEEQLSLFPLNFNEDDARRRRLLAGVIPVGKREAYMSARQLRQEGDPQPVHEQPKPVDPRVILMRTQVRDSWKSLIETADVAKNLVATADAAIAKLSPIDDGDEIKKLQDEKKESLKRTREQIQTVSWLILLDFAKFLEDHLPDVWKALQTPSLANNLKQNEKDLFNAINSVAIPSNKKPLFVVNGVYSESNVKDDLCDALLEIRGLLPSSDKDGDEIEDGLEKVEISYDRSGPDAKYPSFLFPFADPEFSLKITLSGQTVDLNVERVNLFARLIELGLPTNAQAETPGAPVTAQTPMDMREGWFVIRCVFERPECGPIDPPLVSERTESFQLAGFFDPDAPARPIRIALPVDTSPAGLRKFDKNTAFMMSDMLCGQVNRMKGITFADLVLSVLPWPFHKDLSVGDSGPCGQSGLSFGMMCSLSIPIITICALILLIIIVSLLDFIFRWLPFFMICFPIPGFKAKK